MKNVIFAAAILIFAIPGFAQTTPKPVRDGEETCTVTCADGSSCSEKKIVYSIKAGSARSIVESDPVLEERAIAALAMQSKVIERHPQLAVFFSTLDDSLRAGNTVRVRDAFDAVMNAGRLHDDPDLAALLEKVSCFCNVSAPLGEHATCSK